MGLRFRFSLSCLLVLVVLVVCSLFFFLLFGLTHGASERTAVVLRTVG